MAGGKERDEKLAEPPGGDWKALSEGDHVVNGHLYQLRVVDCGEVFLPSGRLTVCDPFVGMHRGGNPQVVLPPGRYRVRVTLADVSGNGGTLCSAYASLLLSSAPETHRDLLIPGFPVDSGTACFVDDEALVHGMPPEEDWYAGIFENTGPWSWFARKEDPGHIREGIADVPSRSDAMVGISSFSPRAGEMASIPSSAATTPKGTSWPFTSISASSQAVTNGCGAELALQGAC